MPLWDTIQTWFKANAKQLQHVTFPDPDSAAEVATIKPEEHYFRLWLCEMFLTKSRDWFTNRYPAVNAQVRLAFGTQAKQPFTRVAAPPKNQLGRGVYINYTLTELLPFKGGTVELEAGLLDLKGENSLIAGIKVLESFSQLVSAPLGQVLSLAEQVTKGVEEVFSGANGQVHLGFHNTYVSGGGGGGNEFKPGYIAVIGATEQQLPQSELTVSKDHLLRKGKPLEGFDYILFRIEGRVKRDDMPSNIDEPFQEALIAFETGETEKVKGFRDAAIAAALRSPDLTKTDRRRVIDGIKKGLADASALGVGLGLAPGERPTLVDAVAKHAPEPAQLAHLPEISSAEAFGE
jgi:hypothetical protein